MGGAGGRPKITDGTRRDVQIAFRVSKDEKKKIMARAEKLGLSLSEYLVSLVLSDLKEKKLRSRIEL